MQTFNHLIHWIGVGADADVIEQIQYQQDVIEI